MNTFEPVSRITALHQSKLAYVYVRQSSPGQVLRNDASTDLQYHLVERAVTLGWPRERVQVIDDDLGKSGASAESRLGFQSLLAEISLGRVGLVVSWDASRLARNNRDWYQLLELCSLFGVLIADGERVYDPQTYHDRLLLGLSGMMSEAELHHLRQRLIAGARHKAEHGTLRLALPVGLSRLLDGRVQFNPDEEVQARLQLVFAKFKELGVARGVVRYLRREGLPLPSRPRYGPEPHAVVWVPATQSAVIQILKNPAYAGAYVYGRRQIDPTRRRPGRPHSGSVTQPVDKWSVVLHNQYPAYITWEEFLANQAQLSANFTRYAKDQPGVPRKGDALLHGIVHCGHCGGYMYVHYGGQHGEYPAYECSTARHAAGNGSDCQSVRAWIVDAQVERALLAALAPDQIALALAALEELEHEYATLRAQWQRRVERARYEAERAQRQYHSVEPENRLVARTLENDWEAKLRALEHVEHEYQTWQAQQPLALTDADRDRLLSLGADFPALWSAATTTAIERKQLLRLVVKNVVLDQHRCPGEIWMQINWQTGANSEHRFTRPQANYDRVPRVQALRQRLTELSTQPLSNREIAATLNAEGFLTAHTRAFNADAVTRLRQRWNLSTERSHVPPPRWPDGTYSISGAAMALGVSSHTIRAWLKTGRLKGQQAAQRAPWHIPLTKRQIAALKAQLRRIKPTQMEAS